VRTFNTQQALDQESGQDEMEKRLYEAELSGTRSDTVVNEIHPPFQWKEKPKKPPWIPAARQVPLICHAIY